MDAKNWTKRSKVQREFLLRTFAGMDDGESHTLASSKYEQLPPGVRRMLETYKTAPKETESVSQVAVVVERPAETATVVVDGRATVINGTLAGWRFNREEGTGIVTVRDNNGTLHKHAIPNVSTAFYALQNWFGSDSKKVYAIIEDSEKVLEGAKGDPRVFRFNGNNLYAVVSRGYKPFRAEEISSQIASLFPDAVDVKTTPSDGLHGGYITANLGERGPFSLGVRVDCGTLDGLRSAKASGVAEILYCKNQLTLEVSSLLDSIDLPRNSFSVRGTHRKTSLTLLMKSIEVLTKTLQDLGSYIDASKKVKLTSEQTVDVLNFYVKKQRMSRKTADAVLAAMTDDDKQQAPGTLYGLAMATTWVGTHPNNIRTGVQRMLRSVGGEMILVSKNAPEYFSLVAKEVQDA